MPSKANLALVAAVGFALTTIYVVHYSQNKDRKVPYLPVYLCMFRELKRSFVRACVFPFLAQRMRMGVERDIERQRKKEENVRLLKEQMTLQRRLEERDRTE